MDKTTIQNFPDKEPAAPDAKKIALFRKQKKILDTFLSTGAIDRRQYDKSLTCLSEKMEIPLNGQTE